MGLRRQAVDRYRFTDPFDRDVVLSALGGDDAEQMEAVEMPGIEGQDLTVMLFGVGQAAVLVVAERGSE